MENILVHKLNEAGVADVNTLSDVLYLIEINRHNDVYMRGTLPPSYLLHTQGKLGIFRNVTYKDDISTHNKQPIHVQPVNRYYEAQSNIIYDNNIPCLFINTEYIKFRSKVLQKDVLKEILHTLGLQIYNLVLNNYIRVALCDYTPSYLDKSILIKKIHINFANTMNILRNNIYNLTGSYEYRAFMLGIKNHLNIDSYVTDYLWAPDKCLFKFYSMENREFKKVKYIVTEGDVENNSDNYKKFLEVYKNGLKEKETQCFN